MSIARVLRVLLEKRRQAKVWRARKAIRSIHRKSSLKGVRTEISNRVERHKQTWGQAR